MAVSISGLCRNIKNVAHNYTDAQVKVREATSNDPWGPSSTQMGEIADLTYNVVAFTEIMQMVWKRLNDHGKNWRHVYKSLVLLEYLIKTGSEKVAQQCKENIFVVQTLKDFQHLEDNKDLGINVREKAKTVVALLRDDERLKNERVRALKAKERFAQSQAGIGNDTVVKTIRMKYFYRQFPHLFIDITKALMLPNSYNTNTWHEAPLISLQYYQQPTDVANVLPQQPHLDYSPDLTSELEAARPQTVGEEALQLQLALAMSREEAEQEETKIRSDDMRLQLALKKSKETSSTDLTDDNVGKRSKSKPSAELLELGDLDFGNNLVQHPTHHGIATIGDSWNFNQPAPNDPWGTIGSSPPVAPNPMVETSNDPWSPIKNVSKSTGQFGATNFQANDPWKSPSLSNTIVANQESAFLPFKGPPEKLQTSNNPGLFNSQMDSFSIDPFAPLAQKELQDYDIRRGEIENRNDPFQASNHQNLFGPAINVSPSSDPYNLNAMKSGLPETGAKPKKGVASLIEEHSNLVNLDNLLSTSRAPVGNPFEQHQVNPFQAVKPAKPSINELLPGSNNSGWPTSASNAQQDFNPFF